jgi:hypothetical protein
VLSCGSANSSVSPLSPLSFPAQNQDASHQQQGSIVVVVWCEHQETACARRDTAWSSRPSAMRPPRASHHHMAPRWRGPRPQYRCHRHVFGRISRRGRPTRPFGRRPPRAAQESGATSFLFTGRTRMAVPVGGDRGGRSRLRVLMEARGPLLRHVVDFKATVAGNTETMWSSRRSPGGGGGEARPSAAQKASGGLETWRHPRRPAHSDRDSGEKQNVSPREIKRFGLT